MANVIELKTSVEQALNDAEDITIDANLDAETIRIEDSDGNELDIDAAGALTVGGAVDVTDLPEPIDASGATITVDDNGLFDINGIDSTVTVQEDAALDVSGATVTVDDSGAFTVDDISATLSVQEDSPLDVSGATVTVTDDGAFSIDSLPEPIQTVGADSPNGTSVAESVGTSSVQLLADNSGRASALLQNLDPDNDIFVGFDSNVTTNDGVRVGSGGGQYIVDEYTGPLFAIATGSDTDVRVQEVSVSE